MIFFSFKRALLTEANLISLKTKSSSGSDMVIEYIMSSVTNELKVVDMTVDGKYHRTSWMSPEGVSWLMDLLMDDYSDKVSEDVFNIYS